MLDYLCLPLYSTVLSLFPQTLSMGVKVLQCFPFYRRCKERCTSTQRPPEAGERTGRFFSQGRFSTASSSLTDSLIITSIEIHKENEMSFIR